MITSKRKYTFVNRTPAPDYAKIILDYLIKQPFKQRSMKAICGDLNISASYASHALAELKSLGVVISEKQTQLTIFKVVQ